MKNLKKFFAFSIATAMVAGAVWAGTPGFMAFADETTNKWYWDRDTSQYTQSYQNGYTEVWKLPGEDNTYIGFDFNKLSLWTPQEVNVNRTVPVVLEFESQPLDNKQDLNKQDLTVSFKLDNTSVAQVLSSDENSHEYHCEVEGITTGTANISCTVYYKEKKLKTLERSITVNDSDKDDVKLHFKNVDPEEVLTIKVGDTFKIELAEEDAEYYSTANYKYVWGISADSSKETIATVTDGEITGIAEGQCLVTLGIWTLDESNTVAFAEFPLEVVSADTKETTTEDESSKKNATPVDPTAATPEAQAKQEQTPESIANYQNWLATYGGGDAAAAPVGVTAVSGEVGQPGSEAIVNTGAGEPVTMFQSNDATNTLLAAPVGVVPSGTKIETVEAGKDTPAFKAVQNKLSRISRRGTIQKVYGIAGLNPDGSLLTLINGKAAMSMPMPTDITVPAGKSLKVYLIDDNGQTTKLDTAIDQGRVVFEIPKFGTFAFVVE